LNHPRSFRRRDRAEVGIAQGMTRMSKLVRLIALKNSPRNSVFNRFGNSPPIRAARAGLEECGSDAS
jgi:hypothetical protein